MAGTRRRVRAAYSSATVRQAASFAVSSLLLNGLGMAASALLARTLTVDEYAGYSFGKQLLVFSAMFFEFGLFLPAARLAARADRPERRRISGGVIALYLPVSLAFGFVIFALSFVVDACFDVKAGPMLRVVAPAAVGYPLDFICLQLAQGLGRLHSYSIAAVLSRAGCFALLATMVGSGMRLTSSGAMLAEALFLLAGWVALLAFLRPRFRGLHKMLRRMLVEARDYGFSVYVGRVLSMGTYHMDTLILAAFSNPHSFAGYVVAVSLTNTVGLPAAGLATALFGRLARQPCIERRWIVVVTAAAVVPGAALCLTAEPLILLVYSSAFLPAARLVPILAGAQLISAVTRLFNTFLAAHGRGADLRSAAIALTGSNLVLNLLLIPGFGPAGAAWASALALAVNLYAHVVRYRRAAVAETAMDLTGKAESGTGAAAVRPSG